MNPRSLTLSSLLLGSLAVGCGAGLDETDSLQVAGADYATASRQPARLDPIFARAAADFGVPADLLKAIGHVETRWQMIAGGESEAGADPAYGIMALRGARLQRAALLAGLSEAAVRGEPEANIRAAAALLRAEADAAGIGRRDDLGAWARAVAAFSGIASPEGRTRYVHDGVYRVLQEGVASDERVATLRQLRGELAVDYPSATWLPPGASALDYGGATWRPAPSSNYTSGRSASISLLVIHTCAGAYPGCVGWLTTPYPDNPYKTSAHYVVNEAGTQIAQLVNESDTAHHVGASWNGLPTNSRSIGIEHGGFPYDGSNRWTEGQIAASAKLSCDIVRRRGIIRDRQHILGHYQPDPVNRPNDPGKDFPWADYMNRINTCIGGGGGGGGGTITVDSNQANNGPDAQIDSAAASNDWVSSVNVAGYYGSGYWIAPTAAVSDAMTFRFRLAASGRKTVYAWWTAASDRSTTTPFVVFDAAGTKVGTAIRNQQVDGGRWVELGAYDFTAGWNKVSVSRWTGAGKYVVADAIQVR